jgi:hypothetical protein
MTQTKRITLQWRAAFAAALLITMGAFLGVCADRLWLVAFSGPEERPQVSVETLSDALNLNVRQRDEIRALVDSIGWAISEALEQNPESLSVVARHARARLERAVPVGQRPRFRNWMDGRRSEMLDRMRGQGRMRGGRGRGRGRLPPP